MPSLRLRHVKAFVALALVLAVVFVRLGFWQLDRLAERRALNSERRGALSQPPIDYATLPPSRESQVDRHVIVRGTPDFANDFVLMGRSRSGSPGVHVFTPVRLARSDTAVLVNRGWVYAADAATIDLPKWREDRVAFQGYTRRMEDAEGSQPARGRGVRSLTGRAVAQLLSYPVYDVYVVAQDSVGPNTPARLPPPDLSEGRHLSYAFQWFAFAAIAVIGGGIVVFRTRAQPANGPTGA